MKVLPTKPKVFVLLSFLLQLLISPAYGQDKVKLRVSATSKTLGNGPLWVAVKKGFFSQQGLDVDLVVIRGPDIAIQALAGGSLEIAGSGADAPITAVERGLDLVMIGGLNNGLSHSLMGGKKFKSYEDLRGATLGGSSLTSGVTFALRRVLKSNGLEYPRDYKILIIGGSPQTFAALTAGQIDATTLASPLNYAAEDLGFNEIGRFIDAIPNYQLGVLSLKRSWAEKNRAVLIRTMKAMALSMRWLHQNKEAAIDFLSQEIKLNPAHARKGWEFYTRTHIWHPDGDINVEGLKTTIQMLQEASGGKGAAPSAAKYIDQSYLRDALKELNAK